MIGSRRTVLARFGVQAAVLLVVLTVVAGVVLVGPLAGRGTTPTEALGAPRFVDVTRDAGIDHRYDGDPPFEVGGGVAAFDCTGDSKPELYLAGGELPAALYRNESPTGGPLRFAPLPSPTTDLTSVTGAYPLDIDADGLVDLAVLRKGETLLLRGLGDCRFEVANERWGFDAGANEDTSAFAATWEDGSAFPTLAVGRYLGLDEAGEPTFDCAPNALFRPDPSGSRYGPAILLAPGFCTLSLLFSDWDRSGRRDLRMTNDRHYYLKGTDQLWRIAPGEEPRAYGSGDGWVAMQIWGMGIASADLTGDGYLEYYLTSQGDNKLQTLTAGPAEPRFRDIALKRGVTAARPVVGGDVKPSTSWHAEFADVNDDGFLDLLVTKGNVIAQLDYAALDPSDLFLGQPDGTFLHASEAAGIVADYRGRGAALVDLDLDGLLDLVETPYGAPAVVRRNVGAGTPDAPVAMGNWIALRLRQPGANRDAIGSWLEVRVGERTTLREVSVGGGHAGGQLGWLHVGLGPSRRADVRVTWPDGTVGPWLPIEAGTFGTVERDAGAIAPWTPSAP